MVVRIDPARPLRDEVRRISDALLSAIAGHLDGSTAIDFHEARKAIKKLRALLRLTRKADTVAIKQADGQLRDAARSLAGAREADAAIEMLERFIRDYPDRIVDCRLGEMRAALLTRRASFGSDEIEAARFAALAHCNAARVVLANANFDGRTTDHDILAHGMTRTLKHWRKRLDEAMRTKPGGEAFHDLRKAVKAHGAQLALLRDFNLKCADARRREVDALGERLGELNDVADMRARLRTGMTGMPDDIGTKAFDRLMKSHAQGLARKAVRRADRLVRDAPRDYRREMRQVALEDAA